jgi:hypothetical protein
MIDPSPLDLGRTASYQCAGLTHPRHGTIYNLHDSDWGVMVQFIIGLPAEIMERKFMCWGHLPTWYEIDKQGKWNDLNTKNKSSLPPC